MLRQIRGTKKKRGRPRSTGPGVQIGTRWQQPLLSKVDDWAKHNGVLSRAEAIRLLVMKGLGLVAPPHQSPEAGRQSAPLAMTREVEAFLRRVREGL